MKLLGEHLQGEQMADAAHVHVVDRGGCLPEDAKSRSMKTAGVRVT
ncbi:MAG: hypothetical protein JST00_34485 [Deltaproteobacteria bacterium]|nr:hypothetical protein [Deltaproteobacteria bacterium]